MAGRTALVVGWILAGKVSLAYAQANSCPAGTVPIFKCKFSGGSEDCNPGVNYGAMAKSGGPCSVPSPDNGCMLQGDSQTKAWTWKSNNVQCCNCFPVQSPCPMGSVPFMQCDFNGGNQHCERAVNTGAAANPTHGECEVPSPSNGCMLQGDQNTKAWKWQSQSSGTQCCNCYQLKGSMGYSLAQARPHVNLRSRAGDDDGTSMMQLPLDGGVQEEL